MSFTTDDADALISRLAGPLQPAARGAFIAAAEDALTRVPCWGEGAVYRAVSALQKSYFDPPLDRVAAGPNHYRSSKLASAPAVGVDDPRCGGRDRNRLRAV